jgi:tRNA A-37 threonylcarbamoyl transferase component Bud32
MTDQHEPKSEPAAPASTIKELSGAIGKYNIVKPLGKGAMGMVYLAHDTILERDVALKVMVANIADDPELNERFKREAKAVARMTHPNVVNVFDLGSHTDGSPYIAMELLKGMDLQKAMRQTPPLELDRKVAVIVQVLAGLAHAHQAGIVHRDIKPANIFIQQDGSVKIMDFGVARLTTASMTGTGNIVGTADYMSPEQVKGAKVDGRSDVFSVGCMLFELIAGRRPFHSDNLMAIFYKITHEEPNFDLVPTGEQYDALLPLLKKSLAKNLEDRYQTAYEFAVELREYLKAHATSASGQHALEGLLEMEAPTHPPQPLTDAQGATIVPVDESEVPNATMDLGSSASRRRASTVAPARPLASTVRGGVAPTVVKGADATTVLPGGPSAARGGATRLGAGVAPTVVRPTRPEPRPMPGRVAREAPSGNPTLYVVLGVLLTALVGAGGYIYLNKSQTPPMPTPTPIAEATVKPTPVPTPVEAATPTPPPPTPAPPPTFAETVGKGAVAMKNASAAFNSGDYDRALRSAQEALKEDPGHKGAQQLVERALGGQKAQSRLRAAQAALDKGDYPTARSEAEAARSEAPWDRHATDLLQRIGEAQREAAAAQQQREAEAAANKKTQVASSINNLLAKASDQLAANNYDAAIALYDEALKVDPSNSAAMSGRTGAVSARAIANASAGGNRPAVGKSFQAGKTAASSPESRAGSAPEGFEESAGVTVKKGTTGAELPGKINFEFSPQTPKAGERYTVKVSLVNEGTAPIALQPTLAVTTTINGKKLQGPIPALVKEVAPRQSALVFETQEFWKEDTQSWSMEVVMRTTRGETYKNQLTWK